MRKTIQFLYASLGALCLGGVVQAADTPVPELTRAPCDANKANIICGDSAAEDLVALPGSRWILASAYAGAGGLRLIDADNRKTITLPFRVGIDDAHDRAAYPSCPGPLSAAAHGKLLTHGLAIAESRGGVHTVYAVHHDTRESLEVFRIDTRQPSPSLKWVGCVVAPDTVGLNSVAPLPGGGFVATNFMPRGQDFETTFGALTAGKNTGDLWEWHKQDGWKRIPKSEGSGLNGIVTSSDGKTIYAASWDSKSIVRLSRNGKLRTAAPLGFRVDNIQWREDGQLIAAGQTEGGSKVVSIDPQSLAATRVADLADTPMFASASVGLQLGGDVWLGSYGSPNIAVVRASGTGE